MSFMDDFNTAIAAVKELVLGIVSKLADIKAKIESLGAGQVTPEQIQGLNGAVADLQATTSKAADDATALAGEWTTP